MKAAVYYENGGPEVFRYEDVADPTCPPEGVLIRVEAISVEGGDLTLRRERPLPVTPYVGGISAAGVVLEVGAKVEHLKVGQRVATIYPSGAYAELRAVPAVLVWPVPDSLDMGKAASVVAAFGTANECLFQSGQLARGETVLIQAGASGVGIAAIQLAKQAGARVFATASDDARLERLRPLGLDEAINYQANDFVAEVMRLTDSRGVDLVIDSVGGSTLQASLDALKKNGRVVFFGNAGGGGLTIDLWPALRGNKTLKGVDISAELMSQRVHDVGEKYLGEAARGGVEVIVDRIFPLSEAAAAHAYVESRVPVGRVLLTPA